MGSTLRLGVSWLAWPALLMACIATTAIGFSLGRPVMAFNLTYVALAVTLLLLERWMPHETAWSVSDGQAMTDIAHTLVSNGTIQALIVFSGMMGLSSLITSMGEPGLGIWPRDWPLAFQVALGLIASEFGLYWAHRIAHQWTPLWHFHAIHHSVEKLWIVNSGRFHFVDAVKSTLPGIAILAALGAPMEVLTWLSAITGYIGILTHCNIEMRFGLLSVIFNTPELHRWHHSKDLREGNKNFGENIMVWDWVFGTWFNENRRPPIDIGIEEPMPARFRDQILWPFRRIFRRPAERFAEYPDGPDAARPGVTSEHDYGVTVLTTGA